MPAATLRQPGTYPVTLTITSGKDTDLLVGELVVPDPTAQHANGNESRHPWLDRANYLLAALVALFALAVGIWSWRLRRTSN
jgi:hypothetical protein